MRASFLLTLIIVFNLNLTLYGQENTMSDFGNVGIGTLNPSAKLDVNGHVRIDSTLMIKDSILIQKDARIIEDLKVEGQLYLPNISFVNGLSNSFLLSKDENGQVKSLSLDALSDALYSKVCVSDTLADILSPTWQNGLNKIYYECPKVNVGISTNMPRVKLDVRGTTYTDFLSVGGDPLNLQAKFHLKMNSNSGSTENVLFIESQSQVLMKLNYQGWLNTKNIVNEGVIYSGKMVINAPVNNGSPFYIQSGNQKLLQLDEDGTLHSRTIKIDVYEWPDYVFYTNYNLLPLKQVKNFISQNGHLPEVPSAKEMTDNGLNIAEINQLLLKKIEELTLYIIEQDERLRIIEEKLKN